MRYITILFFIYCFTNANGQNTSLKIGDWTTHYPYKIGNCVTQSKDKVFFSNQYSIFSIDKGDNSIDYWVKGKQLSGNEIKSIKYNKCKVCSLTFCHLPYRVRLLYPVLNRIPYGPVYALFLLMVLQP